MRMRVAMAPHENLNASRMGAGILPCGSLDGCLFCICVFAYSKNTYVPSGRGQKHCQQYIGSEAINAFASLHNAIYPPATAWDFDII